MTRTCLRFACLCLLFGTWAVLAQDSTRAAVSGVASTIEQHYFDPERGEEMARQLRGWADAGEFDAASGAEAIASALTARVRPMDGHLRVRPATGVRPPMRPRASAPADAPQRADAGIRKVEVLPGNIGYLGLEEFAHFEYGRRDEPARTAIDAALARLARTGAMVVDVRGNHGGSPAMVGYLVSAFLAPGADPYNRFHTRKATFSEAPREAYSAPRPQVPLYVLIDGGTGSAAESFAYTLSAARRATLVGERSGGAANPGEYFPAGNGLEVFVPTGSPVNPVTHGNWEGEGVKPDVASKPQAALEIALALARKELGSRQAR